MLLTRFVVFSLNFENYWGFNCKKAKDSLKMPHTSMATDVDILITLLFVDRSKRNPNLDVKVNQSR